MENLILIYVLDFKVPPTLNSKDMMAALISLNIYISIGSKFPLSTFCQRTNGHRRNSTPLAPHSASFVRQVCPRAVEVSPQSATAADT